MTAIQSMVWRHICIISDNLNIELDTAKGGEIILPKSMRIQGTKPALWYVLDVLDVQGGFLCDHIIVTSPSYGTLTRIATGWIYTPTSLPPIIPPATGRFDHFTFKLSSLGQDSDVAICTISLI